MIELFYYVFKIILIAAIGWVVGDIISRKKFNKKLNKDFKPAKASREGMHENYLVALKRLKETI